MPAIDSLEPLAEALGLSVGELLSGRELTAEELPKEAGVQLVETMRKSAGMVWRGALAVLLALALLAGLFLLGHYAASVSETDRAALARRAEKYLGSDGPHVVETERKGTYLAALYADDNGAWCMSVFDRDTVFKDRWGANGGKPNLKAGKLGSWNFGNPQEAVIICGGDLPEEAACYTFQNSGITYICPIKDRQVLDVFLLPENGDIRSHYLEPPDAEGQPLGGHIEGAAIWEP